MRKRLWDLAKSRIEIGTIHIGLLALKSDQEKYLARSKRVERAKSRRTCSALSRSLPPPWRAGCRPAAPAVGRIRRDSPRPRRAGELRGHHPNGCRPPAGGVRGLGRAHRGPAHAMQALPRSWRPLRDHLIT